MKRFRLAGSVLLAGLALGLAASFLQVPPLRSAPASTTFELVVTRLDLRERMDLFSFSRSPVADLVPRTDGVRGSGKWIDGDRVAYRAAYAFWQHADPGFHDYRTAFRFFIVIYEANPPVFPVQINDRGMSESCESGRPCSGGLPYPYEQPTAVAPLDAAHPGASFEFYHMRPLEPDKANRQQLLARFVIPAVSSTNPKVRWYYEGHGTVVATYEGVVKLKVIMSAMDEFYTFCVDGVPASGCD